ncbi:hypothetical protein [Sphingomonas montana]|uniref:hypothetical protein n=1 Tax=Sphingomonas montana TaxID=1843236 RepID=UPI00096D302E|nr:hypothetical protein [Sphingomonas montana]
MNVLRFRSVGWVAAVATAALGCYLVTQRVAGERHALAKVEHRILLSQREIRRLGTEIETRGRLSQLERWNTDVLALSAPRSGQYIDGELQLASFNHPAVPAIDSAPGVQDGATREVAYPAATPDGPAAEGAPVLRHANYVRPKGGMTAVPQKVALNSSDFADDLAALAKNEATAKRTR